MKNDQTDNKFKELLDKLQQESWQLELLISGFAIFGLFSALEPIKLEISNAIIFEKGTSIKLAYDFALYSCYILIINLIAHVILRGLWIGAIGLRYVSNEIDYKQLNYNKRFTAYLKNKVGSFDNYIAKLENYCSILFAVTFLILFYFITVFFLFSIFLLVGNLFIESGFFSKETGAIIFTLFLLIYVFVIFIIFIDFITQGYLKKKEWTSFLYLPLYKVFSYLTLSFLYRALVYNFLDNKFGRRIAFILVPLYGFIFYFSTFNNVRSSYLNENSYSSKHFTKNNKYFSLINEDDKIWHAAIQSKVISKPYINVFIPFKEKIEDFIFNRDSSLIPKKDIRGYKSNLTFFSTTKSRNKLKEKERKTDSIYGIYLKTFNDNYKLKIDSIFMVSDFHITKVNKQLGFETILPLKNISEGKHLLKISKNIISKKTKKIESQKVVHIPFWYYKE